jgi:pimeloyl-ACP methyl ester carboxylesterase
VSVDEHTIELGSVPVYYRAVEATGAPPVYLHDLPTSSDDWIAALERTGGIAPDLIGFGRSAKGGELDYSITGLADYVEDLLAELAIERARLVGHGWSAAVALELARRHPARIDRLLLINPLPLLDGFHWPKLARAWRLRAIGELTMGFTQRWMLARALRRASVSPEAWPGERVAAVWSQFDQGTQRAILRLHRSVDNDARETPVTDLGAPALIMWGEEDPWFPVALAEQYAALVPGAELERLPGAGHWPLLDRPTVLDAVARFVAA